MNHEVLVLILAGGRGSRMGPLCWHRPKPLLPMGIGHRLIDFPILNSLESGLDHIAVLADYQRQCLVHYLDQGRARGLPGLGTLDILTPAAGSYAGTADAVFQSLAYVEASGTDTVLVLAADHVYNMDYRPMLQLHWLRGADITVGVVPVPAREALRFGVVSVDTGGRIVGFQEKPALFTGSTASMGIYAFSAGYLRDILHQDAASKASSHDFGRDILPGAVRNGAKVLGYRFSGFWRDVGTLESFYQTSMLLIGSASPPTNQGLARRRARYCRLGQGGSVHKSQVAPNSLIRGEVYHSSVGPGCVVAEGAVVRNSILLEDVRVGRYSVVDTAVLDSGARVRRFCHVGVRQPGSGTEQPITLVGPGARVAPGTPLAAGYCLYPGVKTEQASDSPVAPGQLLSPVQTALDPPAGEHRTAGHH